MSRRLPRSRNVSLRRVAVEPPTWPFALLKSTWWPVCLILLVFFIVVLSSYSPLDPAWSHTSTQLTVSNKGGAIGAWVADILLYIGGYSIVFLLFFLGHLLGWGLQKAREKAFPSPFIPKKIVGLMAFFGCCAGLENQLFSSAALPFGSGGLVGALLGHTPAQWMGLPAAVVLLCVLLFPTFAAWMGVSWLTLIGWMGAGIMYLPLKIQAYRTHQHEERKSMARAQPNSNPFSPEVLPTAERSHKKTLSPFLALLISGLGTVGGQVLDGMAKTKQVTLGAIKGVIAWIVRPKPSIPKDPLAEYEPPESEKKFKAHASLLEALHHPPSITEDAFFTKEAKELAERVQAARKEKGVPASQWKPPAPDESKPHAE